MERLIKLKGQYGTLPFFVKEMDIRIYSICLYFYAHTPPHHAPNLEIQVTATVGFPGASLVKNPPANAGDTDSIPGS